MPETEPCFSRLLMLQGPVGPFFRLLAGELRRRGVSVEKVNLNAGDSLFFPDRCARSYRGRPEDWPVYFGELVEQLRIDAVALFGDARLHHRQAVAICRDRNIPVFVFEEGYFRPDHVTLELGGVNGNSPILRQATMPVRKRTGRKVVPVGNTFPPFALWSALYWMAKDAGAVFFPHYRHHRTNSLNEGVAYLRSGIRKAMHRARDRRNIASVLESGRPYFLLPLQVYFDSQITVHSPFLSITHMLSEVIGSFAANAPLEAILLIKHHPLDRGHCDYRNVIGRAARFGGCADRVIYCTEGHLPSLLDGAAGVVTCNSTVGLSSLWHGTPVIALGRAIYNRPGLTAQCPLDRFWAAPPPVNRANVSAFIAFLKSTSQVNGSFYTSYGRTGIFGGVADLMARQVRDYRAAASLNRRELPVAPPEPQAGIEQTLVPRRLPRTNPGA